MLLERNSYDHYHWHQKVQIYKHKETVKNWGEKRMSSVLFSIILPVMAGTTVTYNSSE
jgi:hypothetical protein